MYICSMISVIEVYNTVRDLCNKDQKGFVTPSVFNTFAEIAQQNVFSEMFRELSGAKQLRARNLDASGKDSVYRGVKDDISRFITEVNLDSELAGTNYVDANVFKRPTDLFKIASIHTPTDFTTLELVYDSDKMPLILSSNLSAPTEDYPVAYISKDIEVFPDDVTSIVLTYYRQPASKYASAVGNFIFGDVDTTSGPNLAVGTTFNDGCVVPDIPNCRHFELPEHYKGEIISEIAKMIGIRLRDEMIIAYAGAETNEK